MLTKVNTDLPASAGPAAPAISPIWARAPPLLRGRAADCEALRSLAPALPPRGIREAAQLPFLVSRIVGRALVRREAQAIGSSYRWSSGGPGGGESSS